MACRFCDFQGYCTLWNEEVEMNGCSEEGYCICEDDEDPSFTCEEYEEM